jgi:glutaredoxin
VGALVGGNAVTRRRASALIALAALAGVVGGDACKRGRASVASEPEQAPMVRDDSDGLLLTWIDDKGDFHVETGVAQVPMMGRDAVRVVDPAKDDRSHGDRIFAADLRQLRADGTYAVRTMARADFEAIAVARREKAGPTLGTPPPAPPSSASPDDQASATNKPPSRALVIIYGAEWCGACHDAARYLRRKGVAYVEKDVEKDPSAAREMQQKLAKRGLHTGSIPVLDVRGKVIVGFNPAEVEAALGEAL